MSIVAFSYAAWILRYPEFTNVSDPVATEYFNEACLYLDNTACSLVPYQPDGTPPILTRAMFLNMITAHIAALNAKNAAGQLANPLVGRISDATEGTVNVKAEYLAPNSAQWWIQTPYGASYWQASAQYRTFRPIPGPQFGQPPYIASFGAGPWSR